MESTRLPGKVLRPVAGVPLINRLLDRLRCAQSIDEIVVAIPDTRANDVLEAYLKDVGAKVFRGDESNVLERFIGAVEFSGATTAIRITGDCPLVDPALLDSMVGEFVRTNVDYLSNVLVPTYPDGLDIEIFDPGILYKTRSETTNLSHLEHVTLYAREATCFSRLNFRNDEDLSARRWTVDDSADLNVVESVFMHFGSSTTFTWQEVRQFEDSNPETFSQNRETERNKGMSMSTGQKLWTRAKRVIPGGNSLLSKRPEMFLPEQWPTYFSKCRGAEVWDLDGRRFLDLSIMGIGTNILGYGHEAVDAAVSEVIDKGNMSSLNCPEEVLLAERLIEIHPWAEMVRFARTGGEANAVAVRIARAATGRSRIAFCGYHGWHDWYLSSNLASDSNLDGHLLPGLSPSGVPRELIGTSVPFEYNNLEELKSILANGDVAAVVMEVSRNFGPASGFLQSVRDLATQYGAVLIFDECTSGFRETFGGLHKKFGVNPDMAMFGKALGNGYAITAVLGTREVMDCAQSTFISSTFWTERIGPSAALATLSTMEALESWKTITATGALIQEEWKRLSKQFDLVIEVSGLPALASFSFKYPDAMAYKTLLTQHMLDQGILAATSVYVSVAHTEDLIDKYLSNLSTGFALVSECIHGENVADRLRGPICDSGFKRLN
jgi:glutamate-1-semialdehyde 2,1-aminomutase